MCPNCTDKPCSTCVAKQKRINRKAYHLYGRSCECGCVNPIHLNLYKDRPINWSDKKDKLLEFIKDAKCLCYNCWAGLHNGFLP